ncbi:MAG: bifunctional phosphopantothenoylcysteine decarboxylase/phosphopantothenate--cysteine ligase CoaBC [Ignavibacteria bacterium]|nr:bifunctional phosphopantothenoylcysteine decarboxylase/phosphopantothenate--cysteine ligase CoaBC [Ignavibacteria bacterium]
MNIILGITGSVSAYKTPWLVRDLIRAGHTVRVVMTPSATQFVAPLALEAVSQHPVIMDPYDPSIQEGGSWHVHLARWADVIVIAPCSATTLARLATGLCDTALMTVVASRPAETPLVIAPAMDTDMWLQPSVQRNIAQLRADAVTIIDPESGELASGLVGAGRLAELGVIVGIVGSSVGARQAVPLRSNHDGLRGKRVVITAGPTHERIDAVRAIVNHSTGTMGFALAAAAQERGALVTLIAGPVALPTPRGVERIDVTTAAEMHAAVEREIDADVFIMAAAVADFTPAHPVDGKIKKQETAGNGLTLTLVPTVDILAMVGAQKQEHQTVVGFALEHTNVVDYATQKLSTKNADMIVANRAGVADSGFGVGSNTITIITPTQPPTEYPPMSKRACAEVILDAVEKL